jgi:hypothetical protein
MYRAENDKNTEINAKGGGKVALQDSVEWFLG